MLRLSTSKAACAPHASDGGTAEPSILDNAAERAQRIAADASACLERLAGIKASVPNVLLTPDMAYGRGLFVINASVYDAARGELRIDPIYVDDFHIAEGVARHNVELWHAAAEVRGASFYAKGPLLEAVRRGAPRLFALYYGFRLMPLVEQARLVLASMGAGPDSENAERVRGYFAKGSMGAWGLLEDYGTEKACDIFIGRLNALQGSDIGKTLRLLLRTEPRELWERSVALLRSDHTAAVHAKNSI